MDSGSGSNSQISNPKEESKRPQEELSQTNNSPDQEHGEKWSKEMALEKKVQEAQAENSALRIANARILLDNLKMSQELENRRCPTCTKSSSLEGLQLENAILREELQRLSNLLVRQERRYVIYQQEVEGPDLELRLETPSPTI
ncbi:Uncharacterized protein Adt_24637 [Abeliophyllum distichum]|uniref:Uncharacterized protein n=1 Tax=Abeliophyllum distichum TaxID=126358 RepID=A0ABD1SHC9_9LAMI